MNALYYFHSSPGSQRVRLALAYKGVAFEDHPLRWDDDETFYELGVASQVPVLQVRDNPLLTDSIDILSRIDILFPGTPPLAEGRIDEAVWEALLDWRDGCDALLERLYAPIRPAWREIGEHSAILAAYKREAEHRFGMSLEALANDRYDGFAQFARMSRLPQLARHLADHRFYTGEISIADILLCADIFPLQLHDGVALPIDLMCYLKRVEDACGVSPGDDLLG